MILLTIGSDRNLFMENSDIWKRYLDYGKLFEEIHVIVFSAKKLGNKKTKIGNNVFIYPTDHIFKASYLFSVYKIVKNIMKGDHKDPNTSELSKKDILEKDLSYRLGGIFFKIQNNLGRFCRERQYADALEQKLKENKINYRRESPIEIAGRKSNFADFIIENKILVELKTKPFLLKDDYYQTLRYLQILNIELGLLVNFRSKFLKPKRVLNYKMYSNLDRSDNNSDISDRVVITTQDPFEAGLAGWVIKKIYKIPLQIQVHTDFLSPYFWQESIINKLRVVLAKFLIIRADSIRVVSERIKKSIIANCKLKIENSAVAVLPIFVDTDEIRSASIKIDLHKKYPQFDFIILMASRLTREKNIGLAIKAMAELVKNYPKLGLVIVGSGPEENDIRSSISYLKLSGNVVLEGWSRDLASYYKTADIYLLTSNYEGYGRSVIEAMAAGAPVVMSDVGLAGEVVKNGENGLVFAVNDTEGVIKHIETLASDGKMRSKFSVNGKAVVEKLMTKEHYLKLYKQLIEQCIFNH